MRFISNILLISICSSMLFTCGSNSTQMAELREERNDTVGNSENFAESHEDRIILFFGNSLTAGMGLDPSESFPALIQKKIDSLGYNYRTVNAGLSGETTAGGKNRADWVLDQQKVDIFVLELGANDGLRGVDPVEAKKNLKEIVRKVKRTYPDAEIILAGMMVPPSMGSDYAQKFVKIFPELAEEEDLALIPFLLENVAGERELNQKDGIHPTAKGQRIVAKNVWNVLKEVIENQIAN